MKKMMIALIAVLALHRSYGKGAAVINDKEQLRAYLAQEYFPLDSSAKAVVLAERGYAFVQEGQLEYTIERTIKILHHEAGADLATVVIPKGPNTKIRGIKGITYNLEQDQVTEQSIRNSEVLLEKFNSDLGVAKFNLPSVRKGSVIHYSYKIFQPTLTFIPEWSFQGSYPALVSEYEIYLPHYYNYTPLERVNVPVPVVKRQKDMEACGSCSFKEAISGQGVSHLWVRRNVPAFHKEPHMGSEDNYRERVKIHLNAFSANGMYYGLYNNWNDYSEKFMLHNDDYCGQVFASNNFLNSKVDSLTQGKATALEKARAIYTFVRNTITETSELEGSKAGTNIRDVMSRGKGSAAGINLLLVAMLRKARLPAEPVLLSTREREKLNPFYPDPDNINHLVGRVRVEQGYRYLDASDKCLPFGLLRPACYNGYCRVVREGGGEAELNPDSLLNKTTVIAAITPQEGYGNRLLVKVDEQMGIYNSILLRRELRKDSLQLREKIARKLAGSAVTFRLEQVGLRHADDPEKPLVLHYEASFEIDTARDVLYLDPYIYRFFEKSPFSEAKRAYAIEMDYREDMNYILRLALPQQYAIDDYPKSAMLKFGEEGAIVVKNIMAYEESSRTFSLNSRFTTNATVFDAALYPELRSFYDKAIEEQQKKIVLKKVN